MIYFLGFLIELNLYHQKKINSFLNNPSKPKLAIIGGSKISSKINLINNLLKFCDTICIGGAMANTFLYSQNYMIGKSMIEKNLSNIALSILNKAKKFDCEIILPSDVVCSKNVNDKSNLVECNISQVSQDQMILDLGKKSIKLIEKYISKSNMILWNGPLGAFEFTPFEKSSVKIANLIKIKFKSSNIATIAGGGDTLSLIKLAKAKEGFSYMSKAGGAFLEWLEGNESPGIIALKKNINN